MLIWCLSAAFQWLNRCIERWGLLIEFGNGGFWLAATVVVDWIQSIWLKIRGKFSASHHQKAGGIFSFFFFFFTKKKKRFGACKNFVATRVIDLFCVDVFLTYTPFFLQLRTFFPFRLSIFRSFTPETPFYFPSFWLSYFSPINCTP